MRLFLCEKSSQGKDISRVLGASHRGDGFFSNDDVAVTWARGHLYELAPPQDYDANYKKWRREDLPIIPKQWQLNKRHGTSRYFKAIRALLSKADEVVIATDAGREGELIAREVLVDLNWRGPVFRLWVSAFNDKSLSNALKDLKPGIDYEPLYHAAIARQRSDWLVGMNLTRAYTCMARDQGNDHLLSVGRVQSPTLALIVRRDQEIAQFVSTPYHIVSAKIYHTNGTYKAKWIVPDSIADSHGRCIDRTRAETIASRVAGATGIIESATTERKREATPLLLAQPQVQQLASRLYSLPVDRTDALLQELYDTDKLITYPRTESQYLAVSQEEDIPDTVAAIKSNLDWDNLIEQADLSIRSRVWNDAKLTDHHAIVPTSVTANLDSLSADKRNLYTLISTYYLAQFFPSHEYDKPIIISRFKDDRFKASGRVTVRPGWRAVIRPPKDDGGDTQSLPTVSNNDSVRVDSAKVVDKKTQPPAHYTDDTLIEAMTSIGKMVTDANLKKVLRETSGIGTSATRSEIVKTLQKRDYVERKKKKFILSTEQGRSLVAALSPSITAPQTTALMEQALADIAAGNGSLADFEAKTCDWLRQLLNECYSANKSDFAPTGSNNKRSAKQPQKTNRICPQCSKPLVKRNSATGAFYGCSGFSEGCRHTEAIGKQSTRKRSTKRNGNATTTTHVKAGDDCPHCSKGKATLKNVKSGNNAGKAFLGCTLFPKCRFFQWIR